MEFTSCKYNIIIDEEVLRKHKITQDEYNKIEILLGRTPNLVEIGVFSAMWSEHCSYKTTRIHLKKMYIEGEQVICGPGENAGIIDGGDEDAIIFKMESHNHPSFIEPFNGAATGVGGILRDIFTMGARPVAILNSLRFGNLDFKKTSYLLDGVISGISFYGNCVGIPCLGGECTFDESYNTNNLTNVMAIGIAKKDKIFYSAANEIGGKVVYFGSRTGRDGIHGAATSSATFDGKAHLEKNTVQIGDPFTAKLLIEACLELMESGCILSIQDMGAAGLTCSCAEMAGKGNNGIEIELNHIPTREVGMNAYEIMLSESQERMLMVLKPGQEENARAILEKWELDFAIIGEITNTKRFIIKENGAVVSDIPIHALSAEAPSYSRPFKIKIESDSKCAVTKHDKDLIEVLKRVIQDKDMINKSFIWERYDTTVSNRSIITPGRAGGGVIGYGKELIKEILVNEKDPNFRRFLNISKKIKKSGSFIKEKIIDNSTFSLEYRTFKGLAAATKCTPRYVLSDANEGAKHAVCATYRIISACGAKPLALTNCLNFGSPETEEVMGQIILSIEGISEAARILKFPVVSGNVSLYNQTSGQSILPTPAIGGVGILDDYFKSCSYELQAEEEFIFVIGETKGHISNTVYARQIEKIKGGICPPVDIETEKNISDFLREQIQHNIVSSAAAVLDGGILGTLAEMIIVSRNNLGASLQMQNEHFSLIEYGFSEDAGRFICTVPKEFSSAFIEIAIERGIIYNHIGFTCSEFLEINSVHRISVSELKHINNIKVI